MTLTVLFTLASLLLFVSIEPFRAIGVLLSICYLPGLSFITLGKRDTIAFEDLLFAFPVSMGVSGLITLGALFLGLHVKFILIVIHAATTITLLLYLSKKSKNKTSPSLGLDKNAMYFFVFALLLTLVLSIPYFIGPNRGPIASHAFHHSSFVTQILNGIFPPENPGLGGTMIGYYWGFHALIAAMTSHTAIHHIQIMFTLNAISLFMIICIAYAFSKAVCLPERYCYIAPLAMIGLMRSDAMVYFINKLISGEYVGMEELIIKYQYLLPHDVILTWIGGLPWLDTRLLFLSKFYNISAMPLAISFCLAYLLLLFHFSKDRLNKKTIYVFCLSVIITASILCYPPLAIVPLLFSPLWAAVLFFSTIGHIKDKIVEAAGVLIPCIMGLLIISPYLLFIITSRDVSSGGQGGLFALDFYTQSIKNIVVYLIPLPVICYGIWISLRKGALGDAKRFLITGTLFCLFMILFTRWPFDNSYKYNYILVFFFGLFFVLAVSEILTRFSSRIFRTIAATVIVVFFLSGPLLIEAAYIASCFYMDRYLTFNEGHMIYAQDEARNEAYAWLRNNTPPETLIILSYVKTLNPCCGINPNYEVAAIAERNLYVIKDTDYTTSNPEYLKRITFREKLFNNPKDPGVMDFFISLKRPVYLLLEKDLPTNFIVEDRFKDFNVSPGRLFEPVFESDGQKIYRLKLKDF